VLADEKDNKLFCQLSLGKKKLKRWLILKLLKSLKKSQQQIIRGQAADCLRVLNIFPALLGKPLPEIFLLFSFC